MEEAAVRGEVNVQGDGGIWEPGKKTRLYQRCFKWGYVQKDTSLS